MKLLTTLVFLLSISSAFAGLPVSLPEGTIITLSRDYVVEDSNSIPMSKSGGCTIHLKQTEKGRLTLRGPISMKIVRVLKSKADFTGFTFKVISNKPSIDRIFCSKKMTEISQFIEYFENEEDGMVIYPKEEITEISV